MLHMLRMWRMLHVLHKLQIQKKYLKNDYEN